MENNKLYKEFIELFKKGGDIHINPKNKGKFTSSAKRAGMGVQEFARHVLANKDKYSPTLVKRANFARNAKRFKHQEGGSLYPTHNDDALLDPRTFNEAFADKRDKQLLKAYNSGYYGKVKISGLDPIQYMKDLIRLNSLTRIEYKHDDPDTYGKYLPTSFKGITEALANRLRPNVNAFERQRALDRIQKEYSEENTKNAIKLLEDMTQDFDGSSYVTGAYIPQSNVVAYTPWTPKSAKVHEQHHSLDKMPGLNMYDSVKENFLDEKNKEYWWNSEEIMARVKELQFDNRLKPEHTYTHEDLQNMRRNPNFKWHGLDKLKDDELLRFINNSI